MKDQPEYIYTETITFPNMVARIYRPVLTEEERSRRMKEIKRTAINLLKEVERSRNEKVFLKVRKENHSFCCHNSGNNSGIHSSSRLRNS